MSEQPLSGESPDTSWTPPFDPELDTPATALPTQPTTTVDTSPLSTVALVAAGAGALNLLLTFACVIAWLMDEQMGLSVIGASNGLWVLLGITAIGLGAYIQRQQKLAAVKGGTAGVIATVAILSGMFIMTGAVLLPLISAMRSIISPSG